MTFKPESESLRAPRRPSLGQKEPAPPSSGEKECGLRSQVPAICGQNSSSWRQGFRKGPKHVCEAAAEGTRGRAVVSDTGHTAGCPCAEDTAPLCLREGRSRQPHLFTSSPVTPEVRTESPPWEPKLSSTSRASSFEHSAVAFPLLEHGRDAHLVQNADGPERTTVTFSLSS